MGTSILGIGQSALAAAQLGIATTGHNIANANTPGYSRQLLLQSAAAAQADGGSFIGQGTKVGDVVRVYNDFIAHQLNATQSTQNFSATYLEQASQISNLVSDQTAGISPALQEFFSSVQNLSSTPDGTAGSAARQSVLSSAASLVGQVQSLSTRLDQIGEDLNNRISQTTTNINIYAKQISDLNDTIETAVSVSGGARPNDLLDQRDLAVTNLSKLVNVTVVEQSGKYNIFMGTGQPLVLGAKVNVLQQTASLTDPSRMQVSYESNGTLVQLNEKSLNAGELGGLFSFRSNSLDVARNSVGRLAISIATEFNDQHKLGQDLAGQVGTDFFKLGTPSSTPSSANTGASNIVATFSDVSALTLSDYRVQYLPADSNSPSSPYFKITRVSDGVATISSTLPRVVDGINFNLLKNTAIPPVAITPALSDEFLIKPTAGAATGLSVGVSDVTKIAAGTPVSALTPSTNLGTGKFTPGTVDSSVTAGSDSANGFIGSVAIDDSFQSTTLSSPLALTFKTTPNALNGFPIGALVSVTTGGVTSNYEIAAAAVPAASPPKVVDLPYTSGSTISYNGLSFVIKDNPSTPAAGDVFTLSNALPVRGITAASTTSTTAVAGDVSLDSTFQSANLSSPLVLTFAAGSTLTGLPNGALFSITTGGVKSNYQIAAVANASATPPQVVSIPYTSGSTISYGGVNFIVKNKTGAPTIGDTFTLQPPVPTKLTYNAGTNSFSGFPPNANVTVKNGSTTTTYSAGASIPYVEGAKISFNGLSFVASGSYRNGDVVTITNNSTGTGDNRNAVLLSGLQTKKSMASGTTSFQGAYGQFVSAIGNKAHEMKITNDADSKLLDQAVQAQQSESGVNLDEEAANLLRYQQAYQAAGKLMQIASQLFDALLALGR